MDRIFTRPPSGVITENCHFTSEHYIPGVGVLPIMDYTGSPHPGKGYHFLWKVYKRVRVWTSGRNLPV